MSQRFTQQMLQVMTVFFSTGMTIIWDKSCCCFICLVSGHNKEDRQTGEIKVSAEITSPFLNANLKVHADSFVLKAALKSCGSNDCVLCCLLDLLVVDAKITGKYQFEHFKSLE